MPGTAAARAGIGSLAPLAVGPFQFAAASSDDDAAIRRLLRENPLIGEVSVSLDREPDASLAASIEGDVHQTIVARHQVTGQLAGVASRSEMTAFVNGRAERVGYLSQLRIGRDRRYLRTLIDGGFEFCRALHAKGSARVYLVSLIADNQAARRLLVDRRSPAGPTFTALDELVSFVIPSRRSSSTTRCGGIRVRQGSPALLPHIASCLQRNQCRYQFAPCWDAASLASGLRTRGLMPEDFMVALEGERVVGCAALWDQRAFKQVVVRGYRPWLGRARPLVNLVAGPLGLPRLPAVGGRLEFAFLSHVAVDEDEADVFRLLVAAQVTRARQAGLDYLVTGFAARHPFGSLVSRQWAHRSYRSVVYATCWEDGETMVRSLDGRPIQPEVAIL